MSFLFGGARPSGADSLKEFQRKVASSARGMEREAGRLEAQEKGLMRELSRLGREGRIDQATLKAKELIRLRAHKSQLHKMRGNMQGLAQQLQTVHSSTRIQETLAQTARTLQCVNTRYDAGTIQHMLIEFEKQNSLMTSKQEIVEETLDTAFETDGEQAATDEAVIRVFREAEISLPHAPRAGGDEPSLEERLQGMRAHTL